MSLPVTFMWWRLPILRDEPWRISILISIITTIIIIIAIILITATLISIIIITIIIVIITIIIITILLLLVVVERINYSVIHMMSGMSTLTGSLTGPGAL